LPPGISGIIVKGIGGFYYVAAPGGVYECTARGIFRKEDITPLPGDKVLISVIDEAKKNGCIDEILPRKSFLARPAVANVDQIIITVAVKLPDPDLFLVDKLLISAEKEGLNIVLGINKIDLNDEDKQKEMIKAYSKTNYKLILTSSKTGEGFDKLRQVLSGRISVLAGQSGVGKSTILNRLMNAEIMETGSVSNKIKRGRHTTRHVELIQLDKGGYIVDTPGFSSLELTDIPFEELQLYYPEFSGYMGRCRFNGCSHTAEPGCSVKDALNEGIIDAGRYNRYLQLYSALKQIKDY
jgi:ribosome biogenesis GTPase